MVWVVALTVAALQVAYLAYLIRHARRQRDAAARAQADEYRARTELGYTNGHVEHVEIRR